IISGPSYLPLTSICFGLMDREIPLERALEFKVRVGQMLAAAGGRLERHFPGLSPGDGIALERPELRMFRVDYEREVESALRALWDGTLARNSAAASPKVASAKRKGK